MNDEPNPTPQEGQPELVKNDDRRDRFADAVPLLYTLEDLTEIFKISRSHAYRLKSTQEWPHVRLGTELRFALADIQAIQAMNRQTAPAGEPRRAPRVGTRANRRRS